MTWHGVSGGFTTAWAVSQTDRFKCGVMGAGYGDWRAFHGKAALAGAADRWVPGVQFRRPYDPSPDAPHARQSPLAYAERMATPVLCLHGEVDIDVPVDCGYAVFRALKSRGVPAALSVYPREPHGVSERAHVVDMAERTMAWLGRWLPTPANAAAAAAVKL